MKITKLLFYILFIFGFAIHTFGQKMTISKRHYRNGYFIQVKNYKTKTTKATKFKESNVSKKNNLKDEKTEQKEIDFLNQRLIKLLMMNHLLLQMKIQL